MINCAVRVSVLFFISIVAGASIHFVTLCSVRLLCTNTLYTIFCYICIAGISAIKNGFVYLSLFA